MAISSLMKRTPQAPPVGEEQLGRSIRSPRSKSLKMEPGSKSGEHINGFKNETTMPKNIVICCDGTGNEFGDTNSNVVKLYQMLEDSPEQVTYYHPGLGTMGSRV